MMMMPLCAYPNMRVTPLMIEVADHDSAALLLDLHTIKVRKYAHMVVMMMSSYLYSCVQDVGKPGSTQGRID